MNEEGRGTPRDTAQAKLWYERANAQGNQVATERLRKLVDRGEPALAYLLANGGQVINRSEIDDATVYVSYCLQPEAAKVPWRGILQPSTALLTVPDARDLAEADSVTTLLNSAKRRVAQICRLGTDEKIAVKLFQPKSGTEVVVEDSGTFIRNMAAEKKAAQQEADRQAAIQRARLQAEQEARAAQQRQLNERAAATRAQYDQFVKEAGVEGWPPTDELTSNPFLHEGKVIGLLTTFREMTARDAGLFFSGGDKPLLVSSVPVGTFARPTLILLAGRVVGKEQIDTPFGGKLLVPHLKYVGIYVCKENGCEDALFWKTNQK